MLFVFKNPSETRFGDELREEEVHRVVRTCELEAAWEPYPKKLACIENICGKLVNTENSGPPLDETHVGHKRAFNSEIEQVCFKKISPFGSQFEVYHLRGHVTVRNAPGLPKSVSFKGVKGVQAAREIISDMLYPTETTGVVIHMGVVGLNLGKRLQTSPGCYLENRVGTGELEFMEIASRTIDTCNTVRLSVKDWAAVGLEEELRPIFNDMLITGKGSVMHRFTWKSLEWNEEAERKVLEAAQLVADRVGGVV